ncbi:LuxR C-terminal-related transcriptional regulator [Streptomyces sp. NPDC059063]|uniref:helix-turn-helix transcriptional regulator n=1 Tax=unclassified Streptomyces TaxID=2593676 RepID=UPI0036A9E33B
MQDVVAPAGGHAPHEPGDLCDTGREVYARALQEGRIRRESAAAAPCLVESGLLCPERPDHAEQDGGAWLRPTAPVVGIARLLEDIERRVAQRRSRAARLADAFEPFLSLEPDRPPDLTAAGVTVLQGMPRIRHAVCQALASASREVLGIHPRDAFRPRLLPHDEPWRLAEFAARGGHIRALARPQEVGGELPALAHPVAGSLVECEVRTLDDIPECLLVFDRDVALFPAVATGEIAFEVRSPALVNYAVTAFDVLWRLADPLYRRHTPRLSAQAFPPVQRAIARLLTEGLSDSEVAGRLGMNVRTVRVHIAKLSSTLGGHSRAQLGYLIGRSGILEQNP